MIYNSLLSDVYIQTLDMYLYVRIYLEEVGWPFQGICDYLGLR